MDQEETIRLIEATIAKIRPFLNRDGGDIDLIGFRDGIVYITMSGACQGCMMAAADVSEGIEVLIMEEVPGVLGVRLDGVPEDMLQDYMKRKQEERMNELFGEGSGEAK
ncbi:MAG: NifU family protein [Bacilli bacterium]|nr:NifU family protein [Bacilli bacterium]